MKKYLLGTVAMLSVLLSLPAAAQSTPKLVDRYTPLAGSPENSKSLVTGLRDGTEVKFSDGTTYTPKTGKMGNGNVDNALALAEADLKRQGITNPTPEQLKASVDGVLQKRADGQGWGQIAKSMDLKLGDVKRSDKADAAQDRVVPGLGAVDNGNRRNNRSVSGLGDLTLSATNSAYYDSASQSGVDLTGKVKLPTGEEDKGLSSGSTDLTLRADAFKGFDRNTVFGGLGVLLSSGGFLDIKNAAVYTLGAGHKLDARDSVGLSLDGRTALVKGSPPQRELTAFWSRSVEKLEKIQAYFLVGLANGSPDWGVGASYLRAF